ncbi:uncharacterized protein SCHCODRAFT_052326, partial [Schizophyllum commune H4-8]
SPSWNWECGAGEAPIARRPCPQVQPLCCVRFGACTFGIFACPAPATLAGRALLFWNFQPPDPNPIYCSACQRRA